MSNNIFILNNLLAKAIIQDIINANSAKVLQNSFITSFYTKIIANFFAIGSSSFLAYHYSKKCKNLTNKNKTSKLLNDLMSKYK